MSLQFSGACSSRRSEAGPGEEKSCHVVVEDPELDDNPGTTRGTKLSVLHVLFFSCLVNRGFLTADPLIRISVFVAEFSKRSNCRRIFE